MSDELDQSRLRIAWAEHKLRELESLIHRASETAAIERARTQPEAERLLILFGFQDQVAYEACRIASEFAHHLRAALDYSIFVASRINSNGIEQEGTQFPINSCADIFKLNRGKKGCLRFLSDKQIALVESVQPYNGFPLWQFLHRFSNIDKHRKLLETQVIGGIRQVPDTDTGTALGASNQVGVKFQATHEIHLLDPDGYASTLPIQETLEILHSQVANFLDEFDALLK